MLNSITHSDNTPEHNNSGVVLSSNLDYLNNIAINSIAPSPNMLRITDPSIRKEQTNRFVPWFWPDSELQAYAKIRHQAYENAGAQVLHTGDNSPRVLKASQELLVIQSKYLAYHFSEKYEIDENSCKQSQIINKVTGRQYPITPTDRHPLEVSGLLGQEDICLVQKTKDNGYELAAGFLATPTKWLLHEFIGKNMDEIHQSVMNYSTPVGGKRVSLKNTVDKALSEMKEFPEGQFARNNIFIKFDASLALHKDLEREPKRKHIIRNIGRRAFLRSERETLTRLPWPNNDFLVFSIKPHVFTLEQVKNNQRGARLAEAILTNDVLREPLDNCGILDLAIKYLDPNKAISE